MLKQSNDRNETVAVGPAEVRGGETAEAPRSLPTRRTAAAIVVHNQNHNYSGVPAPDEDNDRTFIMDADTSMDAGDGVGASHPDGQGDSIIFYIVEPSTTYLHTYIQYIILTVYKYNTYIQYIHTYFTYIHTYIHTYTFIHIHTYCTYIHIYIHRYIQTVHIYIYYIHTYIHVY